MVDEMKSVSLSYVRIALSKSRTQVSQFFQKAIPFFEEKEGEKAKKSSFAHVPLMKALLANRRRPELRIIIIN